MTLCIVWAWGKNVGNTLAALSRPSADTWGAIVVVSVELCVFSQVVASAAPAAAPPVC